MGSTLLQLVQAATIELGLPTPQYVVRAADNTSRQFGGLANRVGQFLVRANDWTTLTEQFHITVPAPVTATGTLTQGSFTITGLDPGLVSTLLPSKMVVSGYGIMTSVRLMAVDAVNGTVTIDQPATLTGAQPVTFRQDTFPTPPDYSRAINRTQWDRSMRWELRGPQSPQSDQWVRSGIVATGPRRMYREIGNSFRIWPSPSQTDYGSQLVSEYISKYWVFSAAGAGQPTFLADADACVFDDDVMVTGLKYAFFSVKGFDVGELKSQFMQTVSTAIAMDGASPTLDMDRTRFPIFISPSNVQDADFPGSFGNR